jgi:hypothetical protein
MRMFLRQSTVGREPLAIAMSGVRMGERLLQIGRDSPVNRRLFSSMKRRRSTLAERFQRAVRW